MKTFIAPIACTALLWLTAAGTPALGQGSATTEPAAGFGERLDVELVNVDVWVSGSGGAPATGLEAADFEVLHDGQKVEIAYFAEMRGGVEHRERERAGEGGATRSTSVPAAEPAASAPGHVVVYFDRSRLHPRNYPTLVRGLEDFLETEGVEPERVLVLRQDVGLSVEAPFGSSRRELREALDRVTRGAPGGMDLEAESEQALQAIRDSWEQIQDMVGTAATNLAAVPSSTGPPGSGGNTGGGSPRAVVGGIGSGSGPDACGPFANQVQPVLDAFVRSRGRRIAITLRNVSDTVRFVAGLPGVKTLLYLSDGLDTQPGAALASYATSLCPASSAELLSGALSEEMSAPFRDLTRHANTNRVTIYSLQPGGLSSPDSGGAKSRRNARGGGFRARGVYASSQRANERQGLSLIAEETGGRAIFNRNEFTDELAKIGQDLGTYYSLAYKPPPAADGRRQHKIDLRLRDGSLKARYRRGYLEKEDTQWMVERLEGALNLGITNNPLAVRLGAGDLVEGEKAFRLPLHVMVPVERLAFLPQGEFHYAEVTVRIMARGLESGAVATRDKTFRVKGAPGSQGWANLTVEMELGEGTQMTAVGVRDEATGEASFISTTLQVGGEG